MASVFKPSGAAVFYGKVRLGPYRHCRIKLNADRDTSAAWLRELQNAVNRRRARETPDWERIKAHGVPRELMERLGLVLAIAKARGKGWSEHVADYCNELTRAGRNAVYVGNARRYLSAIGKAAGWAELDDVNRDGLAAFINAKREKGRSVTTLCNIRNVVRLFLVWCVRVERADPGIIKAANIDLADPATDRKRVRRALTDAECHRLLKAVAGTPRELTYRLALATGLRRREMTELQWRDVVLDGTPRLCLRPEATKARRADTLPLAPDVAARLAEHGRRRPLARRLHRGRRGRRGADRGRRHRRARARSERRARVDVPRSRLPARLRLPPLTLRCTTSGRRARSARLLSAGTAGWRTN